MLKLGVNIDHVATVREARYRGRGFGEPNPVAAAKICEAAGAHGITAHLREDRRHMQDRDIWKLREVVRTRLNLEMANAPEIISIALKLKPDIVCIVPERRQELTTEGGLDVVAEERALAETRRRMNDAGIEVLNGRGKPFDLWTREIPPAERMSRQDLINTANCYFAALENNDGKGYYPFTDECHRLENGVATSNNPDLKMGDATFNPAAMKVKDSMASGFYGVVTRIQDRRFPIVDRERGVVLTFATFCHGGTVPTVRLSDGRDFNMRFFNRPSSILIFEAFKIEKGLIAQVEALGTSVPYALKTGWPGGISGH